MIRLLPGLLLAACTADGAEECGQAPGQGHTTLVVSTLTARFDAGTLSLVDLDDLSVCDSVATATSDSVVATSPQGQVIDVGRLGHDRLRIYQAPAWSAPVAEFSVERGSNPQDVVRCGGVWWVSRLGRAELAAYDDVGQQVAAIDLSPWADADGLPEAADLVSDGSTLDLALQRLDRSTPRWDPSGPGSVLRIDCDSQQVLDQGQAPANPGLTGAGHDRYLFGQEGVSRWHASTEGTTEWVDSPEPVTAAAFTEPGYGVLISADAAGWYRVRCVDPQGQLTDLLATQAYLSAAQATDRGNVWIAARLGYADAEQTPTDLPIEPGPEAELWRVDPVACAVTDRVAPDLPPFALAVY